MTTDFREYIDPRSTEYRLQPALATSIYYAYCSKQNRQAMLLHEDRSGSSPDIALLDQNGRLWLYEVKRDRITRPAAAKVLCQLLCYALDYSTMTPKTLAELYCEYKKRLGHTFYYPDKLKKRYDQPDKITVLKDEFATWFGFPATEIGGKVTRLAFMARDWKDDAASLLEQVRSNGIQHSVGLLKQYATSPGASKWIDRVVKRAEQFEVFRDAEWIRARFLDPKEWIKEERIGV